MLAPWLILILCGVTEGADNTFQIMLIFKSDVLFDNGDSSRPRVFGNRCACHMHLPFGYEVVGGLAKDTTIGDVDKGKLRGQEAVFWSGDHQRSHDCSGLICQRRLTSVSTGRGTCQLVLRFAGRI